MAKEKSASEMKVEYSQQLVRKVSKDNQAACRERR